MFISCCILFTLLSFLAGANACVKCPTTIMIDGSPMELQRTFPSKKFTYCSYSTALRSVECAYNTESGRLILVDGPPCPFTATC
ncbi:uncharacterized protein EDB91DRAFT_1163856 [Suillus paluster]|uniref:uncharacterized protein n=1 Tax=Suillus paluster TaxID=48578 RepID=UPI001B879158|nr:uncharacterized protein EDB91DRAFT_1163856 [Suillus paluster]KAG1727449.1 hypothetical protein EDB91DRAFT_1163856 [Suillus paluster]